MQTLAHLAEITDSELIGDPAAVVRRARPFELAREGDITFASSAAYRARIGDSQATAFIVPSRMELPGKNLLVASNPKLAFARALQALHAEAYEPLGVSADLVLGQGSVLGRDLSIHPRVTIGRDTIIGDRVTLHPGVVIGDRCHIGDDTVIYANVSIYDESRIGSRVIIHAGTVIGADGFGFVPDERGRQVKLLQLGRVRIEDDCEIGANCTIDRGGFADTVLARGVKLDNLIQVGHHTVIGEDTVIAALCGFSGGTEIGRRCRIAGQVGTAEHIKVGDAAVITAKTAVIKDVKPGAVLGGMVPAHDYNAWRRSQVLYFRLPEIARRLKQLERTIRDRAPDEANSESDR
ncbi:MAG TPA: UDP-3-O-(3-hydroxymyristoyl)glucosamine N-acyltransferase [Blastocatellia bacterium]|nr:UDP-3-O-(3-hydroxymyristoyl)glucosamine N-acyltransferase [Blastocatellia bacterium]